jgi:hypothetical protein
VTQSEEVDFTDWRIFSALRSGMRPSSRSDLRIISA